jgi:hypothetical protein
MASPLPPETQSSSSPGICPFPKDEIPDNMTFLLPLSLKYEESRTYVFLSKMRLDGFMTLGASERVKHSKKEGWGGRCLLLRLTSVNTRKHRPVRRCLVLLSKVTFETCYVLVALNKGCHGE